MRKRKRADQPFEILSPARRTEILTERLEEGLTRIFGQAGGDSRGQRRPVVHPFDHLNHGWTGFVSNPPGLWDGAKLFLIFNDELIGAVAITPVNRIFIGKG